MAFRRQPSGRTLGTAAGAAAIAAVLTVCQALAASCASARTSRPGAAPNERLDPRLDSLIPPGRRSKESPIAWNGTRLGRIETGDRTGNVNWGGDGSVLFLASNHRILRLETTTKGKGF